MARPSNTLRRREQIVDGLLAAMVAHGYDGASIVAIGKAAKLAPGLVHYHFDTKAEVLLALVERLVQQVRARYAARAGDRLDAFIDAHLALGSDADPRAVAAWSIIGAEALRQPDVRRLYRAALASTLRELKRLVAARLREQGRLTRNAGSVSAAIVSAIEGAFRIAAAAPGSLPAGYAAPMVRRLAHSLVTAEPRA
ncbi:MAG: TetR family transcriptional regulator C-terminal domain-containing protein [Archangiaceae bacterium]|nr:TetR family transcriptional regulator C-terminal domain-containing protein [Archangiaceae bacterium]